MPRLDGIRLYSTRLQRLKKVHTQIKIVLFYKAIIENISTDILFTVFE